MKNTFSRLWSALCLGAALAAAAPVAAQAQPFPSKPIKIVVPFAAGGSSDALARAIAKSMSDDFKQPVVVDNRPGAGGVIAMDAVAHAPADGYTLLFTTNGTHSIGPALYPGRKPDPLTAFAPVALMHTLPNILLVNNELPVKTTAEFIAYAKAHPGQLDFASAGNGSASHLFAELFKSAAGIDAVHVPYRGGGAAMPDLISGKVDFMLETLPAALPQVKSGRVRALGVTSAKRSAAAPDVPTIAESGLPGFDATSWSGLSVAAGTPKVIIEQLNAEANRISRNPAYLEILKTLGTEPAIATPEAFDAYIRKDYARWVEVVQKAHIKVD